MGDRKIQEGMTPLANISHGYADSGHAPKERLWLIYLTAMRIKSGVGKLTGNVIIRNCRRVGVRLVFLCASGVDSRGK